MNDEGTIDELRALGAMEQSRLILKYTYSTFQRLILKQSNHDNVSQSVKMNGTCVLRGHVSLFKIYCDKFHSSTVDDRR